MENPVLVLLPGLDGTGDLFTPFVAALGDDIDVHVLRYPPTLPMDYAALEAYVRERLPRSEPFVLLGESFSGPIAVAIAAAPPPNLVAAVLTCTFIRNPQPRLASLAGLIRFADVRLVPTWLMSVVLMGRRVTRAHRLALGAALRQVNHPVLQARLRALLAVDASVAARAVKCPLLYLQAQQDRLVPPSALDEILCANPSVHVAKLDGPHGLLQVCAEEAARVVKPFLVALAKSSAGDLFQTGGAQ